MECAKLSLLILRPVGGFLIVIDVLGITSSECGLSVIIFLTVMMLILRLQISVAFRMDYDQ